MKKYEIINTIRTGNIKKQKMLKQIIKAIENYAKNGIIRKENRYEIFNKTRNGNIKTIRRHFILLC